MKQLNAASQLQRVNPWNNEAIERCKSMRSTPWKNQAIERCKSVAAFDSMEKDLRQSETDVSQT